MISIAGTELEVLDRGQGAPILYLHGGAGVALDLPFIERLAKVRRVIAPSHPGFGRSSLPDWIDSVDDIDLRWFKEDSTVVVTAGASAPESVVDQCVELLSRQFGGEVREQPLCEENVRFPLPKELRTSDDEDQ